MDLYDINKTDYDGSTILIKICKFKYTVSETQKILVEHLLNAGADTSIQDFCGQTALIYACFYRNYDIVKLLLEAGADVGIYSGKGYTALDNAMESMNKHTVKLLLIHDAKNSNSYKSHYLQKTDKFRGLLDKKCITVLLYNEFLNRDLVRHVWKFL